MKNTIWVLALMAFFVAVYFIYDIVGQERNPCGQLFQQTTASLETKLNVLESDMPLRIGRNQLQALSDAAQHVALGLQSCCIASQTNKITGVQFLQCQADTRQYSNNIDAIIARLDQLEQEKKAPEVVAVAPVDAIKIAPQADTPASRRSLSPTGQASVNAPASSASIARADSATTKMIKISELDSLINKALATSVDFQKSIKKIPQ